MPGDDDKSTISQKVAFWESILSVKDRDVCFQVQDDTFTDRWYLYGVYKNRDDSKDGLLYYRLLALHNQTQYLTDMLQEGPIAASSFLIKWKGDIDSKYLKEHPVTVKFQTTDGVHELTAVRKILAYGSFKYENATMISASFSFPNV